MVNSTGVITAWVLVHNGTDVLVKQFNESQETTSTYEQETFDTEQEMQDRIVELGLNDIVLEDEEEE